MRFFRSQRVEKGVRTAAILLVVLFVFLLLRGIPAFARVFGFFEHGLVSIGTGIGTLVTRMTTPEQSLQAQLSVCEERLRASTEEQALLADADRRATELEALLGYTAEQGASGIVARIVARSLPESATIRIDKGSDDGVVIGSAVVIDNGQLLGVVTEVRSTSADVRLAQAVQSHIPAMIVGHDRTIGIVEGESGSLLHMKYIPQDAVLSEGNIVVTSGLEGELPANLVIGVVTTVIQEETAPFLQALIEPLYDAREWTTVLVLPSIAL